MRFIILSEEEQNLANRLEKESPSHIVRLRCKLLLLSSKKLSMKEISRLTDVKWLRIVAFFNAWGKAKNITEKQKTLSIKKGRGAKPKLDCVKEIIPGLVRKNSRNLNAVLSILAEKYQINICKVTLQNFLKEAKI
jgi:ABC-type branched-subunit amino acid transport system ATPase component